MNPLPLTADSNPAATDGGLYVDELEQILDALARLLDRAHFRATQDPTRPDLPDQIRRGFEHIKLVIRRLEEHLAPLDRD
jgi:hypothetical protein